MEGSGVLWDKIKVLVSTLVYRDKEFGRPIFSNLVRSWGPFL